MTTTKATLLPDRGVIKLTGSDTGKFLQGLITNDLEILTNERALHAALLSPQGKIQFEFFVVNINSEKLLEVDRAQIPALIEHLNKYKLRADVKIDDVSSDFTIAALWNGETLPELNDQNIISFADPRLPALGHRLLLTLQTDGLPAELDCTPSPRSDYETHRIALGIPESSADYALKDTFPHEALFDQLNGISFTKGCFIGQEVVSRMQHRRTARKRIVPITADSPLPEPGIELRAGTTAIGTMGSSAEKMGLALIRLDRAAKVRAEGMQILAGQTPVTLNLPQWANFSLEGNGKETEK